MDQKEYKVEVKINDKDFKEIESPVSALNKLFFAIFNSSFSILKDHATLILLITYSVGAAVQVVELSKISPSYIKFFSVTQLIADGAFLLVTAIFIAIGVIFFNIFFVIIGIAGFLEENLKNGKLLWFTNALLLITPVLTLSLCFSLFSSSLDNKYTIAIISTSLVYVLLGELVNCSYKYDTYTDPVNEEGLIGTGFIFRFLLYISFPITILLLISMFLNSYRLPENLDNYDKAKQVVIKDYEGQGITENNVNILYFNDKFMFIEIIKKNKKSIAIYETNSMLFDTRVIFLNEN